MESDQPRVHTNSESLSQSKLSLETSLELLSMLPKLTPFFTRKKVLYWSIRKSEEILNILAVLWTLSSFQNLTKLSEFFMTSKEDSNSFHSKVKRKTSSFAEFRRSSLDQIRSATLLPTMVELLNSFPKRSKSKTQLNWTSKLELLMVFTKWKLETWLIVWKVTTLVESELSRLLTNSTEAMIWSLSEMLPDTNSQPELLTLWLLVTRTNLRSHFQRVTVSSRTFLRSRRKDLRNKTEINNLWIYYFLNFNFQWLNVNI